MDSAELQELKRFIAEGQEEGRRHTSVLFEELNRKIDFFMEGLANLNERLDREIASFRGEMKGGFGDTKFLIQRLGERVGALEAGR